jgi:hypothetical protein
VELRLGLVQVGREGGATEYASPLLRANFGLPNKVELVSEFEYRPDEDELGEGAVGIKWAPLQGDVSFGIETLGLLPVRSQDGGMGAESQLLATWNQRRHGFRLHLNAGGFYDPRRSGRAHGWRASMLAEMMGNDSFRPGFEVFARQRDGDEADIRFGVGIIKYLWQFEIRSAIHAGLTDKAPDVVFNLWLSTRIPLR